LESSLFNVIHDVICNLLKSILFFLPEFTLAAKARIGFSPIRESFRRLIVRVFTSVIVR